ncbi:preprotein translocase subunit SecE [Kangiella profundi]|uniref:Protein translocase subunit SecE n=2 Tax=Kangiella TaxID=261963 RepID=A0A2K9A5N5_9GAMM|nr:MULTISPECIES: preprotein translocase subunit SecE [Kangiella]AUD78050.1 preprotein translocase subunit SecE [Kangiella profundi]WQG85275.1 preprotein translocase subunit SecE [Kangiella aquimarina]GGF04656.1 protein translocase subunit SecE [Kangiella profundi]
MSAQATNTGSKLDGLKWFLAFALIAGGIYGFNYLSEESILIRTAVVLVSVIVAIAIAMATAKGQAFWKFAREARTELRKVIWPTSNETVRTTIMVIIMVILLGLFLALIDWLINSFLISPIIG